MALLKCMDGSILAFLKSTDGPALALIKSTDGSLLALLRLPSIFSCQNSTIGEFWCTMAIMQEKQQKLLFEIECVFSIFCRHVNIHMEVPTRNFCLLDMGLKKGGESRRFSKNPKLSCFSYFVAYLSFNHQKSKFK